MDTKKLLKVGAFAVGASIATLTIITASISVFNPLILPAALILSPIKWSIIGIISTVVLVCSGVGLYHISTETTKNAKNEAQKNENTQLKDDQAMKISQVVEEVMQTLLNDVENLEKESHICG